MEKIKMANIILDIQHHLNPLHVYCRLVERGVSKRLSMSICKYYELLIYSWIVWLSITGVEICRVARHRNRHCCSKR